MSSLWCVMVIMMVIVWSTECELLQSSPSLTQCRHCCRDADWRQHSLTGTILRHTAQLCSGSGGGNISRVLVSKQEPISTITITRTCTVRITTRCERFASQTWRVRHRISRLQWEERARNELCGSRCPVRRQFPRCKYLWLLSADCYQITALDVEQSPLVIWVGGRTEVPPYQQLDSNRIRFWSVGATSRVRLLSNVYLSEQLSLYGRYFALRL